jgi:hypothetical protein
MASDVELCAYLGPLRIIIRTIVQSSNAFIYTLFVCARVALLLFCYNTRIQFHNETHKHRTTWKHSSQQCWPDEQQVAIYSGVDTECQTVDFGDVSCAEGVQ